MDNNVYRSLNTAYLRKPAWIARWNLIDATLCSDIESGCLYACTIPLVNIVPICLRILSVSGEGLDSIPSETCAIIGIIEPGRKSFHVKFP